MVKHWKYLKYILRHKWFVLVAGLKIGAPMLALVVHDISKFRPDEWFAYADRFYGGGVFGSSAFDRAWLRHQHRNQHHWEYWLLKDEDGSVVPRYMPRRYVREMVADWMGAGRAITGRWEVAEWYSRNTGRIVLHHETRVYVEALLGAMKGEDDEL